MKNEKVKELLKKSSMKIGGVVLATALVISTSMMASQNTVPELVTYVDTETTVEITEDEVPLGSSTTTTTSTKTTKKTKNMKLKKAATKTYSKKGKTTTKTTTKKSSTSSATTTTKTTVKTSIVNNYTKGSKKYKRVTTTVTTVTKTVVTKASASTVSTSTAAATTTSAAAATATVSSIASKVDSRVANAFNTLGFTIKVDSSVSYSGLFDAKTQTITLKATNDTIYHELGHFVAFVAGNVDTSSAFKTIYNSEKSLYTSYNASYVLSDSSEYFAESFKEYTLSPSTLKASRPLTYAYIETALNKITSSQITTIKTVYSSIWK